MRGSFSPHLLPRHDNILHRVLACEELPFVTLIADGVHLPPFLLGAMLRWLGPDRAIDRLIAINPIRALAAAKARGSHAP